MVDMRHTIVEGIYRYLLSLCAHLHICIYASTGRYKNTHVICWYIRQVARDKCATSILYIGVWFAAHYA